MRRRGGLTAIAHQQASKRISNVHTGINDQTGGDSIKGVTSDRTMRQEYISKTPGSPGVFITNSEKERRPAPQVPRPNKVSGPKPSSSVPVQSQKKVYDRQIKVQGAGDHVKDSVRRKRLEQKVRELANK